MSYSHEALVAIVAGLTQERERHGGRLPDGMLGSWAKLIDVDRSTLCRWTLHGVPPPTRVAGTRFEIRKDDEVYAALLQHPSFATAHELLVERLGKDSVPSLSTLQRAYHRAPDHVQAAIRNGWTGWRNATPVQEWNAPHRNSHWQLDHHLLDIELEEGSVWMTSILDCFSRAVMGYSLSLQPNQGHVAAAITAAVRRQEGRGPFCGVCQQLRVDGGAEHLSNQAIEYVVHLQLAALPGLPGTPTHNGRVERFHDTIETRLLSRLPGYRPRAKSRRYRPIVAIKERLSLRVFAPLVAEFIDENNLRRPHKALGGRTPLEAWNDGAADEQDSDLFVPEERVIRRYSLTGKSYKIRRAAVHPDGETYIAAEFPALNGASVDVRIDHNDPSIADIWHMDEFLCTAWRKTDAPEQVVADWREAWAVEAGQLRRASNIARKNARKDFKSIIDATPPQPNSRVTRPPLAVQHKQRKATALEQRVAGHARPSTKPKEHA